MADVPTGTEVDRAALLAQLEGLDNPWEYLELVRSGFTIVERAPLITRFAELVRSRPRLERDQLVVAGKDIWNYSVVTMRQELADRDKAAGDVAVVAPGVTPEDGPFMAEAVYNYGEQKQSGYLVYTFNNGDAPVFQERVEYEKVKYTPPSSLFATRNIVLFPNGFEDYGGDQGLIQEIGDFIDRWVQIPDVEFRTLASCYVLFTWVYDKFDALPYLRVMGPWGSGKSRFIQVVGTACYRPLLAAGSITPSPIFRLIDRFHGTLVIDEADFGQSDLWSEIVKLLNVGYQRGFSVLRSERRSGEDQFDVGAYDTFGPKILATRRPFEDEALESRCLSYVMPLIEIRDDMPLTLNARFRAEAQKLRNKLVLWRFRKYSRTLAPPDGSRIKGVEARLNQIAMPLLACLENESLQATIRKVFVDFGAAIARSRQESLGGQILTVTLRRWSQSGQPDRLYVKDVAEILNAEEGGSRKPLSTRRVAEILSREFKVRIEGSGGSSWAFISKPYGSTLARKYNIDLKAFGTPRTATGPPPGGRAPTPSRVAAQPVAEEATKA